MYRYYKITHDWAVRLGEDAAAPRHPDGMHLVTPSVATKLRAWLNANEGLNLLPEEALAHIGAIGLSVADAHASARGELRHDGDTAEDAGNTDPED